MQYILVVVATLVAVNMADIYMHNPRGSNNRLNERSANRRNANRAFDSQVFVAAYSTDTLLECYIIFSMQFLNVALFTLCNS